MFILIGILTLIGILLLWISGQQRRSAGLPAGRVVYSDHDQWGKLEHPLYDPVLNITGKPDYLVDQGDSIIPVEVKSSSISQAPYDSHIYQLAAYCLLVSRSLGKRPPYGILHYPHQDIAVDYTTDLELSTVDLIREIRSRENRKIIDRSHQSLNRCRRCGYKDICDQALR